MKAAKKKATKKAAKPAPKKTATKKEVTAKPASKKKAAVKTAAKKEPVAKKAAPKKAATKKTVPKTAAKKVATKPAAKKKAVTKKAATQKVATKPAAKKKAATNKAAQKKAAPKVTSKPAGKKKAAKTKTAPQKVAKKAAKKTAPTKAKKPAVKQQAVRKAASISKPIPSILLEGDSSPAVQQSGPGMRYDLGPDANRPLGGEDLGELPTAYGTGMVVASARDPHWLYVFWDLTDEQQNKYNRASRDKHLVVRLLIPATDDQIVSETHVHPESRNWFIPVPSAGGRYQIELGYNDQKGAWQQVSKSRPVSTPPAELSEDTSADFATLPSEIPFEQLISVVRQVVAENVPLMEALEQLRSDGYEDLPAPNYFKEALVSAGEHPELSEEQRSALAEVVTMDEVRRVWIGSQEITELVRRQLTSDLSSQAAAARELSSLSSPFGGEAGEKGFWFNVNAELIIYGSTEPDATVTIGDRQIRLRNDGSFSYRFALPDGNYDLPIQATNAEGDDSRNADLSFHRGTEYRGEVGAHPQDERLQHPRPENTV